MRENLWRVLCVDERSGTGARVQAAEPAPGFGPFAVEHCAGLGEAAERLAANAFDAVLLCLDDAAAVKRLLHWPGLAQATPEAAVVVRIDAACDSALLRRLSRAGVQDVLFELPSDPVLDAAELGRSLCLAIERKRSEKAARKAYATDLGTGLPSRQQLIEHMSQLLALRAREPAPMALLVLRVEGFDTAEAAFGAETANTLRRKVAVRLRAAVRSSDVVAALTADTFALLLASTEEAVDAELVARKLIGALHVPFGLTGQQIAVATSVGIASFPTDGDDAGALLRKAVAAAAQARASGRDGFANWHESRWQDGGAANDDVLGPGG